MDPCNKGTVQKVIRLHAHVHTHTHTEGQDYPFLTKPHGPSTSSSCLLATCDNNCIRQLSAFPLPWGHSLCPLSRGRCTSLAIKEVAQILNVTALDHAIGVNKSKTLSVICHDWVFLAVVSWLNLTRTVPLSDQRQTTLS